MAHQIVKKDPLISISASALNSLPVPSNISAMWNLGSILSFTLIAQIFTGLLLAMMYAPDMMFSYSSVYLTMEHISVQWLVRYAHANGASIFFIALYFHMARGIYFHSFRYKHTWGLGTTILLVSMATAFLGYVLPLNQMSFWGGSVITNLFSEVPYLGPYMVTLIWGDIAVNSSTIVRFFSLHFLLPFVILMFVLFHITYLHLTGSNNPLGLSQQKKIPFHSYFAMKDLTGVILTLFGLLSLCFFLPLLFGDDDNFFPANMLVTPIHIMPEWYFLFAYAILRSIPNKMGGVLALLLSVLVLYTLPYTHTLNYKSVNHTPINKTLFWLFTTIIILLTWIGARSVEPPFIFTGQVLTVLYFSFFLINPVMSKFN